MGRDSAKGSTWMKAREVAGMLFIGAGALLGFGISMYHLILHPEWTQAQAFLEMWPWVLSAVVLCTGGVWLLHPENTVGT